MLLSGQGHAPGPESVLVEIHGQHIAAEIAYDDLERGRAKRRIGRHDRVDLSRTDVERNRVYRGVALNDCTEQGRILAARIYQYLQRNR